MDFEEHKNTLLGAAVAAVAVVAAYSFGVF